MKNIGATIAKYRKNAKLSQGELAEKLKAFGFNPSVASVSSWEKDVSVPNALQFLALCETLKISNVLGTFSENADNDANVFKGLNEDGIKRAKEYISLLLLSDEFRIKSDETPVNKTVIKIAESKKEAADVLKRIVRLYNLPASAGTGEFLDGEDYEEIEAGNEVPAATDFGIRIKGNSMEPRYVNGQTVWIKKCNSLENGEIGIFFLDGNAYCKKLYKGKDGIKLISLNPDYEPIIITEDSNLVTFGRVLN